jgi:hypothetical protein
MELKPSEIAALIKHNVDLENVERVIELANELKIAVERRDAAATKKAV